MEIERSSLYREIQKIITAGSNPISYEWSAQVHAGNETFSALKVVSIDFNCDYELKFADEIVVTLSLSGGTYAKRIYPNQSNLEITLFRHPLMETGDVINQNQILETERYTATLLDKGNPLLESNGRNVPTEEVLNLTNIWEISFQLVNKSLEQLRMIGVGGIYRNCTVEDVMKTILTKESKSVKVEGIRLPQGVDMVTPNNKTKRDHIVIPHGIPLVHLPSYVQSNCGGVYNTGIGYYLQGDFWYIYPCYDVTRFNQAPKTMTIINVPRNKFPNIERTYRMDGDNLVVLATGEAKMKDDSDYQQLNSGNGVRFSDATKFMDGFAVTSGNRTLVSRGANNNEFVSARRGNGNNLVPVSDNSVHANPYVEYSKLSRRQGSFLSMVWENSLPSLVFPGMPVRVLYLDEEDIKTIDGVMLKAHHHTSMSGQGLTNSRHSTSTALAVFVQRAAQ